MSNKVESVVIGVVINIISNVLLVVANKYFVPFGEWVSQMDISPYYITSAISLLGAVLIGVIYYKRKSKSVDIQPTEKSYIFKVEVPKKKDLLQFKFSNGSAMSFSLKMVKMRYSTKEEFIASMMDNNQFVKDGSITESGLKDILNKVWNEAISS